MPQGGGGGAKFKSSIEVAALYNASHKEGGE